MCLEGPYSNIQGSEYLITVLCMPVDHEWNGDVGRLQRWLLLFSQILLRLNCTCLKACVSEDIPRYPGRLQPGTSSGQLAPPPFSTLLLYLEVLDRSVIDSWSKILEDAPYL